MGAVLPPTSCLCEQRAQGWAPPTGSLLTGLPHRGRVPQPGATCSGPHFPTLQLWFRSCVPHKSLCRPGDRCGEMLRSCFYYDSRGFMFTQPPALPPNPWSSEPLLYSPNLSLALSGRVASGCRSPQLPLDGDRDLPGRLASLPGLRAAFHTSSSSFSGE